MDSTKIESYVKKAHEFATKIQQDPHAKEELFAYIEEHKKEAEGKRPFEEFFKGETAFFNAQYDRALKHYIQATSVPNFQFFCYRASAFVSIERQDKEKGLIFLEKGLNMYPEDVSLNSLKNKIETSTSEQPVEDSSSLSSNKQSEPNAQFLSQIFEGKPAPKELFSEALPSPKFCSQIAIEELSDKDPVIQAQMTSSKSILKELESTHTDPLKNTIRDFQLSQNKLTEHYLNSKSLNSCPVDFQFEVCHGFASDLENEETICLLTKHSRMSSGGYYIRWNGKGIVLNPGKKFMEYFHQHQHHIRDIDYVIISRDSVDAYDDIKEIYELNQELNKNTPDLQIIHYYLNAETFQALSNYLKPSFKQARNTVHCLELFYDSPDVERMEISEGIHLNYFPTQTSVQHFQNRKNENLGKKSISNLGLRLDLSRKNGYSTETRKIGYLGACSWSPLLAHLMGSCDLLLLAFGHTQPSDYEKLSYNNDSLGFYGSLTLFEEILPRLTICTEFDGLEGDVRFEAVSLIRKERANAQNFKATASHIIPGDVGLKIDLIQLQAICSVTKNKILPEDLHIIKSVGRFGRLKYLSKECALRS